MNKRQHILKRIEKLAESKANDAVLLALSDPEELCGIEKMDLSAVTEFKRSSSGAVELKFIDRVSTLQWLLEQMGGDPDAERLYQALESAVAEKEKSGQEGKP